MSGSGTPASVTIVDDHLLFATALADLVRGLPDFTVAGVAGTGPAAIAAASEHRPDVILLDFHLPGYLATDLLPELRSVSPQSRIIILTSDTSNATRDAAEAAGVDGFLTKEQALDDVADALRAALVERGTSEPAPATAAPEPAAPQPAAPVAAPVATSAPPDTLEPAVAAPTWSEPAPDATTAGAAPVGPRIAPAAPRAGGVSDLRRRAPVPAAYTGRGTIIGVYGAKGGVGTTTIATNLAVTLALGGSPTVLVDLDLGFGDVGIFLDLEGGPSISDAAEGRIDTDMLSKTALRHSSGLRVVASPATPSTVRPEPREILAILEALRSRFAFVVCDVPRVLGPLTVAALRAVDQVVIVTTPELPALRDLERVLARPSLALRARGLLVLNRHPGRTGVALRDVEHGLGLPVSGSIPSDGVTVTDAINRGVPVAGGATRLGRAFRDLAERVAATTAARLGA